MTAPIRNVLFDLDGTLVDSRETIATSILHALDRMDVDAAAGPRVETLIGTPLYDIFVGRFGMEEANADEEKLEPDQITAESEKAPSEEEAREKELNG